MEKFTDHCASLCSSSSPPPPPSSSSSSSSKQSRLNVVVVSTLLASICFLSLRFSPSFLTLLLLLLIPSFFFLANKKSDSSQISDRNPLLISTAGHLFDEKPQRTVEELSAAQIGEELSSDDDSSSNGGFESGGDFESDLWMCLDELALNLPFSDDSSSEDDDSLIEIPLLPYSDAIRTDSNRELVRNLETCLPDLLPDSVLKQNGFVELLEEINEEDNLIEIDISRGFNRVSTVCN
ncbi:uncharacterized protein LOC111788599 isoform X2 [Cucurbita pepo subsp. pepo]|uniref:uncharacterized protein LOC111788599 isoform X2 n=1 Tax=Cucurbita pepo subsp. pepo TaxID=3664 RepID=UPI000C9D847B|nr:uncharacterized protein LOC111788599 isoform X2 [Cucurbita pepo subsp. pepo]